MTDKLARYRAKRDFEHTAEPQGGSAAVPSPYPRFVIQKHAARRLHYDLRLELDGVLKSWALTRGPSLEPGEKRLAVEVEDHPLEYGDFEGTIPKGEYGGGTVMLWDRGFWQPDGTEPAAEALARGELKIVLAGEKLRGRWVLVRLKRDRGGGRQTNWLMIRHRDNGVEAPSLARIEDDRSVASGRSMREIADGKGRGPTPFVASGGAAASPAAVWHSDRGVGLGTQPASKAAESQPIDVLPEFVEPQLCRLVARPPAGADWVHEVKLDGYRMQLRVAAGRAKLRTRTGLDWTDRFGEIAAAASELPDVILDGEVVVLDDDGRPDFAALQAALTDGGAGRLAYFAFDLLFAAGQDVREASLATRKSMLFALLRGNRSSAGAIRPVGHLSGDGAEVWRSACRMQLEGIVSKRLDAPYRPGRAGSWTKAKCRPGQEAVIGGWSGGPRDLRSLLAGVHRDGMLRYAGRVGTGFDRTTAAGLLRRLRALRIDRSPFGGEGAPRKTPDVTWVEPVLVAEIEFAGWTADKLLRQAAFKGLREDKPAGEIVAERAGGPEDRQAPGKAARRSRMAASGPAKRAPATRGGRGETVAGVVISHPGKELWPAHDGAAAVTKLDLARYLADVASDLIPHIRGRPCSAVRAPDGIGGQQFFQRHVMPGMSPLISQVVVEGDRKPYLQLDSEEALVAAAQMAAVELHPWNCAPGEPQVPGRLVFDLDPGPDVPFTAVVAAAKELRERLERLGLVSFCKTTGGKGLHVVTPLDARGRGRVGWPEAKTFAQTVCTAMAADSPERYLVKMTKKLRDGRIFLDYLRNDRMSTAVAPLSPRARPGATVSMPIEWSQVRGSLDPRRFTIRTAADLIMRSKAWAGYDEAARPLEPAIRKLVTR